MNLDLLKIFEKQLDAGKLAHAYLLIGPKGSGKKELALLWASKALGLPREGKARILPDQAETKNELNRHLDYSELDCQIQGSAEQVREFIGKMALKPMLGNYKVAIMLNIEALNAFSANAFLKTLEEPALGTVLILTSNIAGILPTIKSRCQIFHLNRHKQYMENLNETGKERERALSKLIGKSLAEKFLAINDFSEMEDKEILEKVEELIYYAKNKIPEKPEMYSVAYAGLNAFADLKTNKNKKLTLQKLFQQI